MALKSALEGPTPTKVAATLLTNSAAANHLKELRRRFDSSSKVLVFVAYLGRSGLNEIRGAIEVGLARAALVEFFVGGLDQYITDPKALRSLYHLFPRRSKSKHLYLAEPDSGCFHPKLYCFMGPKEATLIVGSANMTGGGLWSNCEASVRLNVPVGHQLVQGVLRFKTEVLGFSQEASEMQIRQYERRFRIVEEKRKAAKKDADQQIRQTRQLSLNRLGNLLEKYCDSSKGARKFRTRVREYREAKKILDQLCDQPALSKGEFTQLYGQLAGYSGQGSLWWSSGLHRGRAAVDRHYKTVVEMIRSIRDNISKDPEEVFRIGLRYCKKVKGLGVNSMTEIMNTYDPRRMAVLNENPITGLVESFGCARFGPANNFTPEDYASFNGILDELRRAAGFHSMAQADQFLDFVYWLEARRKKQAKAANR